MTAQNTPAFFDPARTSTLYLPRHADVAAQAHTWAKTHAVTPAKDDARRVAVFGIDCQIGFCTPGASLYVPGAELDVQRACAFILKHLGEITTLVFSLDTHYATQIFHPAYWVDADGNPPPPMTSITSDDIRSKRWTPLHNPAEALAYCEALEAEGKYTLTIWPYHTLHGSVDHALVPALFEVAHFHATARSTQTVFETKGEHPMTENYSVFEPEVKQIGQHSVGAFNASLLGLLLSHDVVYIWGEASSHCVSATVDSMIQALRREAPERIADLVVLEDCMSPVPAVCDPSGAIIEGLDFPSYARANLDRFRAEGVRISTSDAPGVGPQGVL